MGRAARLKRERKLRPDGFANPGLQIQLQNPVADHHATWVVGNAQYCERVVEENMARGKSLAICGAGPSLADTAREYCPKADHVWGCNSALLWLHDHGHKPTHGFTVDQTPQMCEEWHRAPDVEYLVASTIHPHLTMWLTNKGRGLRWFHNYVGIRERPVSYGVCRDCGDVIENETPIVEGDTCKHADVERQTMAYEDWMYLSLYPPTCRAGSGLNSVTRAIDIARFMGYETISVLGADCALKTTAPPPKGYVPGPLPVAAIMSVARIVLPKPLARIMTLIPTGSIWYPSQIRVIHISSSPNMYPMYPKLNFETVGGCAFPT